MQVITEPESQGSTPKKDVSTRNYRYEYVRVADLKIDSSYHADERFSERHARRLGPFDEAKAGVITVSHRDEALWLLDGNHRRWLAREAGVPLLYAKVFFGLTQREDAAIFHGLSRQLPLQGLDLWQTRRVERDPIVLGVEATLARLGARIVRGGSTGAGPSTTRAVLTVERIYATSPELLEQAIAMLRRVWPEQRRALDAVPLQAIASFVYVYGRTNPPANLKRLEERLSMTSPEELYRAERGLRVVGGKYDTGRGGGTAYGLVLRAGPARRAVLGFYNRGLQHKLPDVTLSDLRALREGRIVDLRDRG